MTSIACAAAVVVLAFFKNVIMSTLNSINHLVLMCSKLKLREYEAGRRSATRERSCIVPVIVSYDIVKCSTQPMIRNEEAQVPRSTSTVSPCGPWYGSTGIVGKRSLLVR